jgi:hypothetical protein
MDLRITLSILDPGEMGWGTTDSEGQTDLTRGEEKSLRRGHGWIGAVDLKDVPLLELQKKAVDGLVKEGRKDDGRGGK